jgi:hypothetical protein
MFGHESRECRSSGDTEFPKPPTVGYESTSLNCCLEGFNHPPLSEWHFRLAFYSILLTRTRFTEGLQVRLRDPRGLLGALDIRGYSLLELSL